MPTSEPTWALRTTGGMEGWVSVWRKKRIMSGLKGKQGVDLLGQSPGVLLGFGNGYRGEVGCVLW